MNEIWKDIPEYLGYYQASNFGRIRSTDRTIICDNGAVKHLKSRILKPAKSTNEYLFVNLSVKGIKKVERVHRLIAFAFIENPSNFNEVNHIDSNKLNNNAENLEWCTRAKNMEHARTFGSAKYCYIEKKVKMYNEESGFIVEFDNRVSCGKFFGKTQCWLGNKYKQVGRPFNFKGWCVL